jgi:hypothetical protein
MKNNLEKAAANPRLAELVSELLALQKKHAGGRPRGRKNTGPSKLDRAVMSLAEWREGMSSEDLAESELRVNRWMTHKFTAEQCRALGLPTWQNQVWCSKQLRMALIKRGFPATELAVVVAYRRSEYRDGMSKTALIVGALPTIGAGYDEPMAYEATEKELAGKVKRAKPHRRKRTRGYTTVPEDGSVSLDDMPQEPLVLWGMDVSVYEDQPVRSRSSKRSWLAPINSQAEFKIGRKEITGAGDGSNGVVPWQLVDSHISYGIDPTIGECHLNAMMTDPVRGDPAYWLDEAVRGDISHMVVQRAEFAVTPNRIHGPRLITVNSLKLDGGGMRVVDIDVACVESCKVADKDMAIEVDRYRAPLDNYIELRCRRPLGGLRNRSYGVPQVRGPMARTDGELLAGFHGTRWRNDPEPATAAVVQQVMVGKKTVKQAVKVIQKARKWQKPEGVLPAQTETYIPPVVAPLYPLYDEQVVRGKDKLPVERVDRVCPSVILAQVDAE